MRRLARRAEAKRRQKLVILWAFPRYRNNLFHTLPQRRRFGVVQDDGSAQVHYGIQSLTRFQKRCSRRRQSAQIEFKENKMARTDVRGYGII